MKRRTLIRAAAAALAIGAGPAATALAQSSYDPGKVQELNRYVNGISTMQGTFVQQFADGRVAEGEFFLRRPGRLRFEYYGFPTVTISDGTWAAIQNTDLKTTDRYPLSKTPLYLLLRDNVDLARDGIIRDYRDDGGSISLTIVDPRKPNDGSVSMVFTKSPVELRRWIITDPQGRSSVVSLRDTRLGTYISPKKFFIEDLNSIFD